jgi:hypothetical protein
MQLAFISTRNIIHDKKQIALFRTLDLQRHQLGHPHSSEGRQRDGESLRPHGWGGRPWQGGAHWRKGKDGHGFIQYYDILRNLRSQCALRREHSVRGSGLTTRVYTPYKKNSLSVAML